MRDLGQMGEHTFALWCADAGLVANGSQIDKTGWDFFVEFPFDSCLSPHEIHKPPCECKVQIKATDNNKRKLPIKVSNLRRLITAQMPAFIIFIEFDNKEVAQRAYVVHVDNNLISMVLKRLHEIEQSNTENKLNKRTITINYNDSNLLENLNGESLKSCFLRHIGDDYPKYINNKQSHLESTGYENGFAQITITTEGEENFKSLMDVSLGIRQEVELAKCKCVNTRFGISSNKPLFDCSGGIFAMPNVKPTAEGKICFKEDRLSPGISFECKFYYSPFNQMVPDELKKVRIEGDFFDVQFNPYTSGNAQYSFSFGEGIRLEVKKFRNAIKLVHLLGKSGKKITAELHFDAFPILKFIFNSNNLNLDFDFLNELKALDSAVKIMSYFEVTDLVDISFNEISRYKDKIWQMEQVLISSPDRFQVEFGVDSDQFDTKKETAGIFLIITPIGSHIFGVILILIGNVDPIENDKYRLHTKEVVIEQRIFSERGNPILNDNLIAAIEAIEEKYDEDYSVVTMFDKYSIKSIKLDS